MRGWNKVGGKDGWLTKALKSRLEPETFKREFLCNTSQSRKMEKDFGCSVKRECIECFYDLYLSAVGCPCSPTSIPVSNIQSRYVCTLGVPGSFFFDMKLAS